MSKNESASYSSFTLRKPHGHNALQTSLHGRKIHAILYNVMRLKCASVVFYILLIISLQQRLSAQSNAYSNGFRDMKWILALLV